MNKPIKPQIIKDSYGNPLFAILAWSDYIKKFPDHDYVPHEVAGLMIQQDLTATAAWRKYLGFTQEEVAKKMEVTQAAYNQMEKAKKPRSATKKKIAQALGIEPHVLDF